VVADRAKLASYFVDACFEHGVEHAVIISMLGAETKTTAYHKQFAEIEEYAMSRAGRPVKAGVADRGHMKFSPTVIRAPPFYQNIYGVLGTLSRGMFYYPLGNPSTQLCHVDYNDVGKASDDRAADCDRLLCHVCIPVHCVSTRRPHPVSFQVFVFMHLQHIAQAPHRRTALQRTALWSTALWSTATIW
jgi:hypothetical protein